MLRNDVRITIFDDMRITDCVNDTEHNPLDAQIVSGQRADMYGKLKNGYAIFLAREKRVVRDG